MQGTILAFDFRSGEGVISGEDGLRYRITMQEWKHALPPAVGQTVDFQPAGDIAGAIYVIQQPSPFSGDKNRLVAALLALFLGMLGVHKFYLGKNTAGLIMLAGGTIGWVLVLPGLAVAVIAFIEFIIYLTTSDADFAARYVNGPRAWF